MNKALTTVLALTAMLAAGCSDGTVAPKSASKAPEINGGFSGSLSGWDTARFSFTIDPARTLTYQLGAGNYITFPAGSLCDPTTSTYGPTQWDQPCNVASSAVSIPVKAWLDRYGNPHLDFGMSVRFVPSAIPTQWVQLTFGSLQQSQLPFFNVLYCPTVNGQCVNEAALDPSVATVTDPISGRVWRHVKHFSGYLLSSGESCDPSPMAPDCQSDGSFSKGAVGTHISGSENQ